MSEHDSTRLAFFLGGHDLEMEAIRDLLITRAPDRVFDKRLSWGAKASAYREEIERSMASGLTPVLVELPDDMGLRDAIVIVDHHGERAGRDAPTSLHQIFRLISAPREAWTRWLDLVAANDRGHIREMRRIGATEEEIRKVRSADRAAQGVTPIEDQVAEDAVRNAEAYCDGKLVVVRLPHPHASAAADRLEMRADPPENVLVLSPHEVNFFGSGDLVRNLNARYPGGWSGGALPDRGFWGRSLAPADIVPFLLGAIEALSPAP